LIRLLQKNVSPFTASGQEKEEAGKKQNERRAISRHEYQRISTAGSYEQERENEKRKSLSKSVNAQVHGAEEKETVPTSVG